MNVKGLVKRLVVRSRALQVYSRLRPACVVILRYHSVAQAPEAFATTIGTGIIHSSAAFEQQMEVIARDYHPVTIDQVESFLRGDHSLPRRAVAITFDDGFRDNYEVAAPILEHFGLRAAFYVTTGCVGLRGGPWFCQIRHAFRTSSVKSWRDPATGGWHELECEEGRRRAFLSASAYCAKLTGIRQEQFVKSVTRELEVTDCPPEGQLMMGWSEIKELHRQGHVIGSHTVSHPNLAHVTLDEMRSELRQSKECLEEVLGTTVDHFSYPSPILEPHWTDTTLALTAQTGYRTAVTCDPGAVQRGQSCLALRRVAAPAKLGEFRWTLEAVLAGRRI